MLRESRRSPAFGRLDPRSVLDFVLQHPATANDGDDDVDDTSPTSLRLRDLLRQIADATAACPGMRADVSTLRAMARSRTTCIDVEIVYTSRSLYARETAYRRSQQKPPVRSLLCRSIDLILASPIDPLSTHRLLAEYNSSALLAGVLLLADSTTTRVGHFVLGGGVRRGHDPRRIDL